MKVFSFSDEAMRFITDYVRDVKTRILELGFTVETDYLETRMFDLENYVKFFSIRQARKRGVKKIEIADAKYILKKFGKPQEFIKSQFKDANTWARAQRITLSYLEAMREKLERSEEARVLDAGCGWGRFLTRLPTCHAREFEMMGVDLDGLSLQYGKTVNEAAAFLKSDIQALPFKDQVFDIIVCSSVIHEVKRGQRRRKAVKEFSRVSKPEGMLYVADAFARLRIISILTRVLQDLTPKVEWVFKKDQLERMLQESGFKMVNVERIRSHALGMITGYAYTAIKR